MRRLDGAVIDIEEADDDDECRNAHWTLKVSAEGVSAMGLQTKHNPI